ncbi:ribonuclease H-like YkuK family protein, partial [Bacillus sp. SIMBA_005]|uniref:ribonuclease H-like YkuK family protein n=1 Tax=Bacillus sp. SIMBA_005 TaxID=3085754 RepID=UPI00397C7A9D
KAFVQKDPRSSYVLSIGTDSQVYRDYTKFITALHLHRTGKGAWGCLKNHDLARPIHSLREKISLETAISQEMAAHILDGCLM